MIKLLSKEMDTLYINKVIEEAKNNEEILYNASLAIFKYVKMDSKTLVVVGDNKISIFALAYAKALKNKGVDVSILQISSISNEDLISYLSTCIDMYIPIYEYSSDFNFNGYINIVESIFHGDLMDETSKEVINRINSLSSYVLSMDLNSGIDIENGKADIAIISDITIALGYVKLGHFLNDAKDFIHELVAISLDIDYTDDTYFAIEKDDLKTIFKKRLYNSHKGTYGYIGVMGGSYKYSGSIKLSNLALSSLIVGGGVSRVIAPTDISDSIMPYLLESTLYPIESNNKGGFIFDVNQIEESIKGLSSLAFGMGIGESEDNEYILEYLLKNYKGKLLIDADGINTLSRMNLDLINESLSSIVLTPHVKEFSRLININVEEILDDPAKYASSFTKKYKCVLVLKGTSTIVSSRGRIYLVHVGSPALSKGGSGDILSGIIAGIMGYTSALDSAISGCYILGEAGVIASNRYGDYATLPRDIISIIKEIMKEY